MKVKTSITLSESLIHDIDQRVGSPGKRSDFIESAVRAYLLLIAREETNSRDMRIINQHARHLKKESDAVLGFQVGL